MTETEATHRRRIPSHLLGGRIRTTTFALCSLWVGLWVLYLFLNQPEDAPAAAPSTAVIISETPYVPYVPPATTVPPQELPSTTTEAPYPSTTVPTLPSTTTAVPGPQQGATPSPVPTTPAPTTTTSRQFPFELPTIPGLSDEQSRTVPDGTDAPAR